MMMIIIKMVMKMMANLSMEMARVVRMLPLIPVYVSGWITWGNRIVNTLLFASGFNIVQSN